MTGIYLCYNKNVDIYYSMNIFSNKVAIVLVIALVAVIAYIYMVKPQFITNVGPEEEQQQQQGGAEGFYSGYWTNYDQHRVRPKMARHAMMNYLGSSDYVSSLAPPKIGLNKCVPSGCPPDHDDDVVCWNCDEQIAEPQNELYNMVN